MHPDTTLKKKRRAIFPEFEGMQCDVQFQKAWAPMCQYITKEDKTPMVWGQYSLKQVLDAAEANKKHKKIEDTAARAQYIFQKLQKRNEWLDIYEEPLLLKEALRSHSNLRNLFEDVSVIRDRKKLLLKKLSRTSLNMENPKNIKWKR